MTSEAVWIEEGERGRQAVPLWRNRDFLLLRSGQAVSMLGSQVSTIAFPLLVLALTGSPAKAGLVAFLSSLPQLLFNLPAGALVDRWDRKRTMILCDAGRMIAMGSIPLTLWLGHLSLAQICLVAFVEGSLAVFFNLSESACLPQVVAKEQIPAAMSQNEVVRRGSLMLGQPLGGLLYAVGRLVPFLADAVSYGVSVVSLLFIRTPFQEERRVERRNLRAEIREGLTWLWHQPFLRFAAFIVGGSNLLFAANYLVVILLAKQQSAPPALIGLIFSIGGAGGVLGSLAAPWVQKRFGLAQVVIGVNWIWAILWPLLAVAPNPIILSAIAAAMIFVGPLWNVVIGSYQLALVPDELRGRVGSIEYLIAWGTIPLGSALSGVLLEALGPVRAVLFLAVCMVGLAIAATLNTHIRNAPQLVETLPAR